MKKLLLSTLVAASLATAPLAHAGNYDGLIAGGIIAGGLSRRCCGCCCGQQPPARHLQARPTRVIYKRGPSASSAWRLRAQYPRLTRLRL